jgi:aminoacyl tRNA synthase complex-interacting multifunctional protein 1
MASRCIIAKTSKLALAARTVLQRVDKLKLEDGDDFAVVLEGGQTLHGLQTIIAVVGAGYAHPELFGRDARERAHVNQWVGLATDVAAGSASVEDAEMLLPMNARHVANTAQATAADAFVYAAAVEGAAASPKSYPKLWKWAAGIEKDGLVAPIAAVIKPAPAVAPSADPKDTAAGAKWAKPNEAEIAARRAQKEQEKAEKERQKAAAAAAGGDAAPAAAGGKAPKGAAAAAPAAPAADEPLSSDELDLRVGLITAVDKHPKADRLFVETIDLGEPTGPRTIVSGLVAYYKAEDLLNKKVIVVANMKAKPLMGVPSNGMVLCASLTTGEGDAATTQLELVPIPDAAQPGERISIGGSLAKEAPAVSKKMTELLAPLRTDAAGVVLWGDKPLAVGAGRLGSRIANALVK